MTDEQIKHMVDRFLGWRLPENFTPDAGISFKRTFNDHLPTPMKHEPVGTNLFDASQAADMVRYMIEGMPCSPDKPEAEAVAYLKKSIQQAIHAATKLWAEIDCEDDDPTAKAVSDISAHLRGTLIGLEQDFPKTVPLPSDKRGESDD